MEARTRKTSVTRENMIELSASSGLSNFKGVRDLDRVSFSPQESKEGSACRLSKGVDPQATP